MLVLGRRRVSIRKAPYGRRVSLLELQWRKVREGYGRLEKVSLLELQWQMANMHTFTARARARAPVRELQWKKVPYLEGAAFARCRIWLRGLGF